MSTLRDIAEFAGVSISTASMAVRDHHAISIGTKRRVWKAQEKFGYRTNLKPRQIFRENGKDPNDVVTVAFLLIDREFSDPAYSQTFHGISQRVAQRDWRCIYLHTTLEELRKGILPSAIRNREVNGLIVTGLYDEDTHKYLSRQGIPLVVYGNYQLGEEPWSACEADIAQGMRLLVRRMKASGYRRFGLLTRDGSTAYERTMRSCYLEEMAEEGCIDTGIGLVSEHSGMKDTCRDMLSSDNRPDVLILVSCTFAQDVYEVCEELALRIPDDLGVIAFGKGLHILTPTLASVQIDPVDCGVRCLEKLAGLIEEPAATPTRESFPMRFVSGGSIK